MNRSESKYFHTALLMDRALISLLAEKDFAYITVKEICTRAGVNRSTFYLHYETIGELLAECLSDTETRFWSSFPSSQRELAQSIQSLTMDELILINHDYLIPYLTFIKENRAVYVAAYKNPACMKSNHQLDWISRSLLYPIMERFGIHAEDQPFWIAFFIQGSCAVINQWISQGCERAVTDIANILIQCIRPFPDHGGQA